MTKRGLWIVIAILALILFCIASIFVGKALFGLYQQLLLNSAPIPVAVQTCDPVPVPVAPVAVCDPSTVPFTDMGELNPYIVTIIEGPAIYEWWTGGEGEGVQRVDVGETITLHGVKGHWSILSSQTELDCVWDLHVGNYGAKPKHEGKTYNQLVVPPPAEFLK